jgi:hypothetical protein
MNTTPKRWPEFDGWDKKAEAIETLAKAVGAHVYCSQKYKYLNIEIRKQSATKEQFLALQVAADMIEQLTDQD